MFITVLFDEISSLKSLNNMNHRILDRVSINICILCIVCDVNNFGTALQYD
jgi:hypothetical protein